MNPATEQRGDRQYRQRQRMVRAMRLVYFVRVPMLIDMRRAEERDDNQAERRSEEHTSEPPSLMRNPYAVISLNKTKPDRVISNSITTTRNSATHDDPHTTMNARDIPYVGTTI